MDFWVTRTQCIYVHKDGSECIYHMNHHYLGHRINFSGDAFDVNHGLCLQHYRKVLDAASRSVRIQVWMLYFCLCLGDIKTVNKCLNSYNYSQLEFSMVLASILRNSRNNIEPSIISILSYKTFFPGFYNYSFLHNTMDFFITSDIDNTRMLELNRSYTNKSKEFMKFFLIYKRFLIHEVISKWNLEYPGFIDLIRKFTDAVLNI